MLPPNIRVDMNCQPTWVTQNAIPGEQELISLGSATVIALVLIITIHHLLSDFKQVNI